MNKFEDSIQIRSLPKWQTGIPTKPGIYVGYSDMIERHDEEPSIYRFDGKVWQHWTGFYDGAITHWMLTDLPYEEEDNDDI